jgi:hypothetical protein
MNTTQQASEFLLDLARGRYNTQLAAVDAALQGASTFVPQALVVKEVMDAFILLNRATAPNAVVSDGRGGWVPASNTRVGPDGQFR